jgi:D-glycero-D-manno-heptose 1,7-bisphosphate phosphatase
VSSPVVFLDRDGVLNESVVRDGKPYPPAGLAELSIIDGARDACVRLTQAGLKLVCVTNQPDVARGIQELETVAAMNAHLQSELGLDAVYTCPHDDADDCECRKPRPGLLLRAASDLDLDMVRAVMVGDRWRDIEAGRAAGTMTVLVDHGYAERQPHDPDLMVAELGEAVEWIITKLGQ